MNSTSDVTEGTLKLNSMPDPARPEDRVLVHRTWEGALRHLCDHFLTSPECNAWAVVAPNYPSILDPKDSDQRWKYAVRARESWGKTVQPLYDLYSEAVGQDALDAKELCWHQSKGPVTVAVGTSGILRLYFRVFRPCIQFIKKSHHRGRDICGEPIGHDHVLLKDRLPSRRQLAYEHWLELRRRCRGN